MRSVRKNTQPATQATSAATNDFRIVGLGNQEVGPPARARTSGSRAFSLVELLIVIAIIAILASLVFPITKAVNRTKLRARAKAELTQLETAIESYKARIGVYPPSIPGRPGTNLLYYELVGTTATNVGPLAWYTTLDGGAALNSTDIPSYYLANVGIVNSARPTGDDERKGGFNFLKGVTPTQIGVINSANPNTRVLVCTIKWPFGAGNQIVINPWRYNSTNPTNNPNTYDLWVDIMIDGKTNRVSNWSREPLVVYEP